MDMKRNKGKRKKTVGGKEEGLKTRARGILLILALCLSMVGTSVVYAEEAASPPGRTRMKDRIRARTRKIPSKDTEKEDDSGAARKRKTRIPGQKHREIRRNTGSAVTGNVRESGKYAGIRKYRNTGEYGNTGNTGNTETLEVRRLQEIQKHRRYGDTRKYGKYRKYGDYRVIRRHQEK